MRFFLHTHIDAQDNLVPFIWVGADKDDAVNRFRQYATHYGHDPDKHQSVQEISNELNEIRDELIEALFGPNKDQTVVTLYVYDEKLPLKKDVVKKVEFPIHSSEEQAGRELYIAAQGAALHLRKTYFMTPAKDNLTGLLLNHGARLGWQIPKLKETTL